MLIDWNTVERVLVIRLRSIGDTVLATPSLIALRRFLPHAQIDILLEDWVAPLLDGFQTVDNVITVGKGASHRFAIARRLRQNRYDVVFNLHGGTTSTFFTRATGARHTVGNANYQYSFLYSHRISSSADFWKRENTHSAEQQMALLGFSGVPVSEDIKTKLDLLPSAVASVYERLTNELGTGAPVFALIHPAAAFATKQWATENFAAVAEHLAAKGIPVIAIAAKAENHILENLQYLSSVPVITFNDLTLPEITALASKAKLLVGNDSGIAHIAAAVDTPAVVIFGSSNREHWRPWTNAPNEIVYEDFECQPCAGYECKVFGEPRCILTVRPGSVLAAIDRVILPRR